MKVNLVISCIKNGQLCNKILHILVKETSSWYYLSVLGGPLLGIGAASAYCLIPYHNVLNEPCYWYEFQIVTILVYTPLVVWISHPMLTVYVANFPINGYWFSYLFLVMMGYGIWALFIVVYYYFWTGFSQPMPLNLHTGISVTFALCNLLVLLR